MTTVTIIIAVGAVLAGIMWAAHCMSKKLDGIITYIKQDVQRYRKRACDVACSGRTLLDERESEKLRRIGHAFYLTKEKGRYIAEDEALIKRMQESKKMVEPLEDETCEHEDCQCEECVVQEATEEQRRVEAEEEVAEDLQDKNHRTAAEKIELVNKDSANPADEAVAATKKVLVDNYGDKTGKV